MTANRVTVTRGLIQCAVMTEDPLPAAAYPIVGELAEVLEKYEQRLREVVRDGSEP